MKMGWVLLAFFANGTAQFLYKYLHAAGLGDYQKSALVTLYVAGGLFALLLLLRFKGKVGRTEILFGLGVGLGSYGGNAAMMRALGGLPAYVVFPMVVGGPILTVALFSRLFFGDRLGWSGKLGILCGFAAVLLLTIG